MDIKSSEAATLADAKQILSKRQKEGELGYEQSQALEHAEKFCRTKLETVKKLSDALKKHDKIKTEELATRIVDVAPANAATLKAILAKERIEITDEEAAAIIKEIA